MSYIINQTNGQILLTLLDGTADGPNINPGLNKSDMNLFGKNYPSYGEYQNENFVKLLQNFANTTPPTKPLVGQLWYDSSAGFVKVYTGTTFKTLSPITVSTTAPVLPNVGDQWFSATSNQLKIYSGSNWNTVGPAYDASLGISGSIVETVYDTTTAAHTVVKIYNNNNVTAIVSFDSAFTPNVTIPGFSTIYAGMTFSSLNNSGVYGGISADSTKLKGVDGGSYSRKDINETFSANVAIGNGDLSLTSYTGDAHIRNNSLNKDITISVNQGGTLTPALRISGLNNQITIANDPVLSLGVATKNYVDTAIASTVVSYAKIVSPTLSGQPRAPTPAVTDNSTQIATTAFTKNAISATRDALWLGSNKTVSTSAPTTGSGNIGDFWFQI